MEGVPSAVEYLMEAGRWAPSADNMQPWAFRWSGDVLELRYARQRMRGSVMGPSALATLQGMGAVVENWRQAADALGAALEWLELPEDPEVYARVRVTASGQSPPREEAPLFRRRTNRGPFRKRALPEDLEGHLADCRVAPASVALLRDPAGIREVADLTRRASAVRFRTRAIHEWFLASLRWDEQEAARGDGLDLATLALPPGGRLVLRGVATWRRLRCLNRLGAYRLLAHLEAQPLASAPGVLLIHAPPDREGGLAAGQALERAWIALNRRGIALQPFYVLPDQLQRLRAGEVPAAMATEVRALADAASRLRHSESDALTMICRIGEPVSPAVRSRRLPLSRLASAEGPEPDG